MAARKRAVGTSRQTSQRKRPRPDARPTSPASRRRRVNTTDSDEPGPQSPSSAVDDESGGGETGLEDVRVALGELQNAMAREKADTFDADMEKTVKQEERRLVKLIRGEKKRQAEDGEFQSQFASLITDALGIHPTPSNKSANAEEDDEADEASVQSGPASLKERHPLYVKSRLLLETSNALFASMNVITEYTLNIDPPFLPTQEWEEDQAEMRRLIQAGRQVTEGKIEELLSPERACHRKGRGVGARRSRRLNNGVNYKQKRNGNDENLDTMLSLGQEVGESDDSEEDQNPVGWGFVAHQIEKGMHAFFKGLD